MRTWHTFAVLIAAAVVWYVAKWPLIIIGTIGAIVWGVIWLGRRFPRTVFFFAVFFHALFRR